MTLPARVAKVTADVQGALSHFQHLAAATEAGLAKDAPKILKLLGKSKDLSPADLKAVYEAAASAASRHAATSIMAHGIRDADEIPLLAQNALAAGAKAATKVAAGSMDAEKAAKLGKLISTSDSGAAALGAAGKLAFKSGWLGHVVPFMGGAVTAFDAKQAVDTIRNPNANTAQKIAGVVTVLADATTFIPIPAVSLIGAAISIPASFLRDNPHPLTALGDMLSGLPIHGHAPAH